jgi:hypothetical protein
MSFNELFKPEQTEGLERKPKRPLGSISDFVVETMPLLLELGVEGDALASQCEMIIQKGEFLFDVNADMPLATLDLIMMETAIVQTGGNPGEQLSKMVATLTDIQDRPSSLTYEDIILVNPLDDDPRLFTRGELGEAERSFYKVHQLIETNLAEPIAKITATLDTPSPSINLLDEESQRLVDLVAGTMTLKNDMKTEHFNGFRKFLGERNRGDLILPGPSGLYSGSVVSMDLLLYGNDLPEDHRKRNKDDFPFYALRQQPMILAAERIAGEGKSIADIVKHSQDPQVQEIYNRIAKVLLNFRRAHYGAAARHIPHVIKGGHGTGGVPEVQQFLQGRMQFTKNSLE